MIEVKMLIEAACDAERILAKCLNDGWEVVSINTVVAAYRSHIHEPMDYKAQYESIIYLKRQNKTKALEKYPCNRRLGGPCERCPGAELDEGSTPALMWRCPESSKPQWHQVAAGMA